MVLKGESAPRIAYLRNLMESLPDNLEYMDGPFELLLAEPEREKEIPEDMRESIGTIAGILRAAAASRLTDFFDQNRLARGHCGEEVYLQYLGRQCCAECALELPENHTYDVEWIDVWNLERETVLRGVSGAVTVPLPGKEGIAILASTKLD